MPTATATYRNPIFRGDYPDPTVLRVGHDYYMTHSSDDFCPGLIIWHSRNLVDWQPVTSALPDARTGVWAPELTYYNNRFYIYYPAHGKIAVVAADRIEGPWSAPVVLPVNGIDPGVVNGDDGRRYLFYSAGQVIELAADGLSVIGQTRKVYDGWKYPADWATEGFNLESPKLTRHRGYYYLTVAEGGTAGPPTSHMVVSARARDPLGPYENSPYNPIVRTASAAEHWWSRGHGTLVDTPEGDWWIVYHAYENGYRTLGRRTLLQPIEWTSDDWFRVPAGHGPNGPEAVPRGEAQAGKLEAGVSDNFAGPSLGWQWRMFGVVPGSRCHLAGGALLMDGAGNSLRDSPPLVCMAADRAYEVSVRVRRAPGSTAGLTLYYSSAHFVAIEFSRGRVHVKTAYVTLNIIEGGGDESEMWFKIVNDHNRVSFFYSRDGQKWLEGSSDLDVSSYEHTHCGGYLSLRPGLYTTGTGRTEFRQFAYTTREPS